MKLGLGPALCFIYSHCSPILISLTQEQIVAMSPGYQDSKQLAMKRHFSQKQNGLRPRVPQSIESVASTFAGESAGTPLGLRAFRVSLHFDDSNFRREEP